jgi:hypothetical protein
MAKKYRGDEGEYLAICDGSRDGLYTFGWYFDEEGYVTCPVLQLLESSLKDKAEPPESKSDWESWLVIRTAQEMGCDKYGDFATMKLAKAAMNAANEALLRGDRKPTPQWVTMARNAGWTPPDGWSL